MFFANEFSKATALEGGRCDEESLTEWRGRMVHKAAVWYYEHLGGQKPIVIVTEDDKLLEQVILTHWHDILCLIIRPGTPLQN